MNRRTSRNQRKVRVPKRSKKPVKTKEKPVEVVAKQEVDDSCNITGCGCGN